MYGLLCLHTLWYLVSFMLCTYIVENTILLANDGTIAYNNEPRQDDTNTVNFSDITHITESTQVRTITLYTYIRLWA